MATITATPHENAVALLGTELKNEIQDFVFLGGDENTNADLTTLITEHADDASYLDIEPYIFHRGQCTSVGFDKNGVLTAEVYIDPEQNFQKHLFAIAILTTAEAGNKIITIVKTPVLYLAGDIEGTFVIKIAISGEAGAVIFQKGEYVTEDQLDTKLALYCKCAELADKVKALGYLTGEEINSILSAYAKNNDLQSLANSLQNYVLISELDNRVKALGYLKTVNLPFSKQTEYSKDVSYEYNQDGEIVKEIYNDLSGSYKEFVKNAEGQIVEEKFYKKESADADAVYVGSIKYIFEDGKVTREHWEEA